MAARVLPTVASRGTHSAEPSTELGVKEDTEHGDPKAVPPQVGLNPVKSDTSAEGKVSAGNTYCLCLQFVSNAVGNAFRSLPIASTLWFLAYLVSRSPRCHIAVENGVISGQCHRFHKWRGVTR